MMLSLFFSPGKYRGADPELQGFFAHELIDDVQEATAGMFDTPLYPSFDSSNHYLDTGELSGLVTARNPSTELETFSISEACGGGHDHADVDDGEDGPRRRTWGTLDGLTPSARYGAVFVLYRCRAHQALSIFIDSCVWSSCTYSVSVLLKKVIVGGEF